MDGLDSLTGDQRAVLALVLGRRRSYDDIARLLSIDRDAVRGRARAALDAVGPATALADVDRARIGDYLLGQLSAADTAQARATLAGSPTGRAWARVVSGALAPLATGPLPEIPDEGPGIAQTLDSSEPPASPTPERVAASEPPQASPPPPARQPTPSPEPSSFPRQRPVPSQGAERPRSSRRGGMVVIGLAVLVVVVVVVIVLRSGHSHHSHANAAAAPTTTSATATAARSSTTSTAPAAKVVAQINLTPTAAGSRAVGIAEVLAQGSERKLAIVAQHVPPNTTRPANAYEVWLYNSPSDATSLGFVNPGVSKNGRLSAAGNLPADASRYKQLVITVETANKPRRPGPIVLRGKVAGLS